MHYTGGHSHGMDEQHHTKEVSLKKCLCIMAAVVKKHLDTGTQIPRYLGDK